jgi:hypothetical protein
MNINIDPSGSRAFTLKALEFVRWVADNKVKATAAVAILTPLLIVGGQIYFGEMARKAAEQAAAEEAENKKDVDRLAALAQGGGATINISGGDPADDSDSRNPLVDAIRAAVADYPGAAPIRVSQYFSDEEGTFKSDIATRGLVLESQLRQVPPQQLEAHGSSNCFQSGEFSSCPVLDKQLKLKAFVEIQGTTEDAKAFLNQNAALILPAVGDTQ